MIQKFIISLDVEEVSRMIRAIFDGDKEEAFLFLKEVMKPQVDRVTKNQRDPFPSKLRGS